LLPDGGESDLSRKVRAFAVTLRERTGLPVVLVDECLTTDEARRILRERGESPRKDSGRTDTLAACLILQEVLDRPREEK